MRKYDNETTETRQKKVGNTTVTRQKDNTVRTETSRTTKSAGESGTIYMATDYQRHTRCITEMLKDT